MKEALTERLKLTAWRWTPPKAFGIFHLIFLAVGVFLCVAAAYLLRKASAKKTARILAGVGLFLAVSELYRQLFFTFILYDGAFQWWAFPFQLCSVPMYLCMLLPFVKNTQIRMGMCNFLVYFNLLGGCAAVIYPTDLFCEYLTVSWQAIVWHALLIFIGLLLIFTQNYGKSYRDYRGAVVTFLVLCGIAFTANTLLSKLTPHTMNLFYVGPGNSPLVLVKDVAARFGWLAGTALYILAVCLGAFLVFVIVRLCDRRKREG